MAPRGGYKKNTDKRGEYVRLDQVQDAEAKLCAASMGQTYETWIADAVAHHLYRCELIACEERFRADDKYAADTRGISPIRSDPQYQPQRPKPVITRGPAGGQGRGPGHGRSYRP